MSIFIFFIYGQRDPSKVIKPGQILQVNIEKWSFAKHKLFIHAHLMSPKTYIRPIRFNPNRFACHTAVCFSTNSTFKWKRAWESATPKVPRSRRDKPARVGNRLIISNQTCCNSPKSANLYCASISAPLSGVPWAPGSLWEAAADQCLHPARGNASPAEAR